VSVEVVRWPTELVRRRALAAARVPRVLLVEAGAALPESVDELEEWVRSPVDAGELELRVATLAARAREVWRPPPRVITIDADGLVRLDDRWVALPALEARIFALLAERPGEVVLRGDLVAAGWVDEAPSDPRALNGVMRRLRLRVAPLGARIHTVRRRGFLLDVVPHQ
jgi:DNA-binding response OmpR family regulator